MLTTMLWAAQVAAVGEITVPSINPESVGIVGLVVFFAIGLATNRLYTRGQVTDRDDAHVREVTELKESHARELERMTKAHERELEDIGHDRDEWKAAHRISETGRVEEREHNIEFQRDIAKPLKSYLEGVRQVARQRRGEVEVGDE